MTQGNAQPGTPPPLCHPRSRFLPLPLCGACPLRRVLWFLFSINYFRKKVYVSPIRIAHTHTHTHRHTHYTHTKAATPHAESCNTIERDHFYQYTVHPLNIYTALAYHANPLQGTEIDTAPGGKAGRSYAFRHALRSTLLCWKLSVSSGATVKSCATGLQPSFEPQKSIFRLQ